MFRILDVEYRLSHIKFRDCFCKHSHSFSHREDFLFHSRLCNVSSRVEFTANLPAKRLAWSLEDVDTPGPLKGIEDLPLLRILLDILQNDVIQYAEAID